MIYHKAWENKESTWKIGLMSQTNGDIKICPNIMNKTPCMVLGHNLGYVSLQSGVRVTKTYAGWPSNAAVGGPNIFED